MRLRQQPIDKFFDMKSKKPFHTSFLLFPRLPTELRAMVWKLSLQCRVIEIQFSEDRGFFTEVNTPAALRTSKDSRTAVTSSYPVCFGNVVFQPRTVFNFSLDTLYIGQLVQSHTLHLLGSLSTGELSKIRGLAIASDLNFDYEICEDADYDYETAVRKSTSSMPSLKLFQEVVDLAIHLGEDSIDEGDGPMKIYRKWPAKVERMHDCPVEGLVRCECGSYHCGGSMYDSNDPDDFCEMHDLPLVHPLPTGPHRANAIAAWGWRPTK